MNRATNSVGTEAKESLLKSKPKDARVILRREGVESLHVERPQHGLLCAFLIVVFIFAALCVTKDQIFWGYNWTMFSIRLVLLLPIFVLMHFTLKPLPWYYGKQTLWITKEEFSLTTWKVPAYDNDFTFKWTKWVNTSRRHKVQGASTDLISAKMASLGTGCCCKRLRYIEVLEGSESKHKFGFGLPLPEQEWIVDQINDFLAALSAGRGNRV